jgi:hypothetical protein
MYLTKNGVSCMITNLAPERMLVSGMCAGCIYRIWMLLLFFQLFQRAACTPQLTGARTHAGAQMRCCLLYVRILQTDAGNRLLHNRT